MVQKPDGTWSPCRDYCGLNTQTVPDHYPLPNIADFTSRLNGCMIFTKLDLSKLLKSNVPWPFGLFGWIMMPFGLWNTGCTIQRLMDQLFGDLPNCFVYVNDILISSRDIQYHLQHVCKVLDRLLLHGLSLNPDKRVFAAPSLDYLWMRVSAEGCVPLSIHTYVISAFPQPSDKKGWQHFLGIVNFYRRFIRGAAGLLFPLTEALKGTVSSLTWSQSMLNSFSTAKAILANVPTLVHPDPTARISVSVDASGSQVGAVLQQEVAGSWAPLSQ